MYVYDSEDQLIKSFGGQEHFKNPIGIAFDDDNNIYVGEGVSGIVKKIDFDGTFLLQLDGKWAGLCSPRGITVYNNRIYIADYDSHCIFVFQTNGQLSDVIGKGLVAYPFDVAVSTDNCLLVTSWAYGCIYSFTLDGTYIGNFGEKGSSRGLLQCPSSLIIDSNGFILVAENSNNRVSIFDEFGRFVNCFGCKGENSGQLHGPRGIALAPNGNIYVCDSDNSRVQIFSV